MGFRKMRFNDKRTAKNLVCGLAVLTVCSASVLSGCAGGDDASSQEKDTAPQEQTQELTDRRMQGTRRWVISRCRISMERLIHRKCLEIMI